MKLLLRAAGSIWALELIVWIIISIASGCWSPQNTLESWWINCCSRSSLQLPCSHYHPAPIQCNSSGIQLNALIWCCRCCSLARNCLPNFSLFLSRWLSYLEELGSCSCWWYIEMNSLPVGRPKAFCFWQSSDASASEQLNRVASRRADRLLM